MPLFDQMYFDQKWSLWDSWYSKIGRNLKVAIITTQYRLVNVLTAQYRFVKPITAMYRRLRVHTGG